MFLIIYVSGIEMPACCSLTIRWEPDSASQGTLQAIHILSTRYFQFPHIFFRKTLKNFAIIFQSSDDLFIALQQFFTIWHEYKDR